MRRRWGAVLLAVLVGLGAAAATRWLRPRAIVAHLNSEAIRRQWGVERAARDRGTPGLLVVRVSGHWYEVPAAARSTRAAGWLDDWRREVAHGALAVVDAATGRPVVQFGPDGQVIGVGDQPAR